MRYFKLGLVVLVLGGAVWPCYGQDQEVVVTGEAVVSGGNTLMARQEALASAFREAVEQGVGTFIQSETRVQNAQVLADNIYSRSQGYVKQYSVVEEGPSGDGQMYSVKIRATVNLTEIGGDLRALGVLQDLMGNPKVLSLIQEVSVAAGRPVLKEASSASIAIEEKLIAHHFDLVDRSQVEQIRAEEMQRMGELFVDRAMEDPEALAQIARKAQAYGAQYLLLGTARIEAGGQSGGVSQANATLRCRVVDASTAELVALTQNSESGRGKDLAGAELYAGQRAGEVAVAALIPQMIQNWSRRSNEGVLYIVKLYGVSSYGREGRKFLQALESIAGVTRCNQRQWDAKLGRLEVDVAFQGGSGDDLVDRIFSVASPLPGFENLDLEEMTGNNMNFKMK